MYKVYIIYSETSDKYYVGYSSNLEVRLRDYHNQGRSRYTSKGIPWILMYSEEYGTELEAIRREREIKKVKSRKYLISLIEQSRPTG